MIQVVLSTLSKVGSSVKALWNIRAEYLLNVLWKYVFDYIIYFLLYHVYYIYYIISFFYLALSMQQGNNAVMMHLELKFSQVIQ